MSLSSCLVGFALLILARSQQLIFSWDGSSLAEWTVTKAGNGHTTIYVGDQDVEPCTALGGGSACYELNSGAEISTTVSLAGYRDIQMYLSIGTDASADFCYISCSTPSGAIERHDFALVSTGRYFGSWGPANLHNDSFYSDPSNFRLFLGNNGTDINDKCYFDNLQIIGIPYTRSPTGAPSQPPTANPTESTPSPSQNPTAVPSVSPTDNPTTVSPSRYPSNPPTPGPTPPGISAKMPTVYPTETPTETEPSTTTLVDDQDPGDDDQGDNDQHNANSEQAGAVSSDSALILYGAIGGGALLFVLGIVTGICLMKKRNKQQSVLPAKSVSSMEVKVHSEGDETTYDVNTDRDNNGEVDPGALPDLPAIPSSFPAGHGNAGMIRKKETECEDMYDKPVQTPGPPPRAYDGHGVSLDTGKVEQLVNSEVEDEEEEDEEEEDMDADGMYDPGNVELRRIATPDGQNAETTPTGFDAVGGHGHDQDMYALPATTETGR